ncbi:TetR family transcriptional regulator [Streptomyces tubbatahanensis]|uniref:TetR family transcriptional regulator n=1 Tax=Streptomyces tubbatahanensis TaxID=2923272 RepID=A0ABY3XXH7_9ACTN|nr:TetR/AcrR family transcriptional regulator [Streptomyces tubbatahanensis]UNS98933.1 TetR family transcriptional regulator [Streptomyces tubbatahanensis]
MRQNTERRAALLDAAIEVLAREGSRGLTLRAVDKEAAVPTGTASNYFAHRGDMLTQVMRRTRERLTPDEAVVAERMSAPRTLALEVELMHDVVGRMRADRSSYLAMMELRLEATRRPELYEELTGFLRDEFNGLIAYHNEIGMPGDDMGVALLYLAMTGLLVDEMTLPDILSAPYDVDRLIAAMVPRVFGDSVPGADG